MRCLRKNGRFIYDVISERDDCTVSAGIDKFGEAYADFPVVKEPATCLKSLM